MQSLSGMSLCVALSMAEALLERERMISLLAFRRIFSTRRSGKARFLAGSGFSGRAVGSVMREGRAA
ncbi:MAG: hypothetical protein B0D96_06730 [Candidatus Sedimenticola endophacoides]|uniref:Uncharacterized protein n=1 Tax=Candidatus Sedimenticola endophacoides TaxID=2548426 RepID=A0A657Q2T6_9GAMM|nr:MAG: hypothetical protein B0D94_11760 [Candidatus Sedimenticola endophacoides]OQX35108.1 MAG: hypothetical protein B0D84_02720 [Candidatus Sedimenticola endophacoides]OQX35476.1 MAG: hypothetical protein B0D96_06730 [Candidatus Sedimenticola endophacoides]OQX40964.1 MAG: hypothetical protein B0D89_05850 [Candidatus Sedimenticola endophacoides]OQX43243.1 MAG: hypothetical protein B0D88_04870 [Candidatus Sedimenticola endophacoides]